MKKHLFLKGKPISNVGFFGLGDSNLALLEFLSTTYDGLSFTLRSDADMGEQSVFSRLFYKSEARRDINEDVLFLSPSVRRDTAELMGAKERGIILSSDVEFFFERKQIPVFAITGSSGKSTTATLLSLMLSSENGDFPASANVGVPMTTLLSRDGLRGTVAELSSFQLAYFTPVTERALITNVTENHLDWHTSFEE